MSWDKVASSLGAERRILDNFMSIHGYSIKELLLVQMWNVVKDAKKPKAKPVIEVVVPVDLFTQAMNRSVEMRVGVC